MNNEQMLDRFFAGEVGKKIVSESTDENLALRKQLLAEIEDCKSLLHDQTIGNNVDIVKYDIGSRIYFKNTIKIF